MRVPFFLCAFVVAIGRRRGGHACPPVTAASRRANTQVRPYDVFRLCGAKLSFPVIFDAMSRSDGSFVVARILPQLYKGEIHNEIGAMGDAYAEVSMERKNLTSMGQAGIIAFVNR